MKIQEMQKQIDAGKNIKREGWKTNAVVKKCDIFAYKKDELKAGSSYVPDMCVTIDGVESTWYATSKDAASDDWLVLD